METKTRIFIADANPDFSSLVSSLVAGEGDMEVVGTADNGADALASIGGTVLFYFIHDKMNEAGAMYLTAGLITAVRVVASLRRITLSYALRNDGLKTPD